jgi:hypothetical protein
MSVYETNRAKISLDELMKYDHQWVAFQKDGSRIIAGNQTLDGLEDRLAALGEDPQAVAFERIEFDDASCLGGVNLVDYTGLDRSW